MVFDSSEVLAEHSVLVKNMLESCDTSKSQLCLPFYNINTVTMEIIKDFCQNYVTEKSRPVFPITNENMTFESVFKNHKFIR